MTTTKLTLAELADPKEIAYMQQHLGLPDHMLIRKAMQVFSTDYGTELIYVDGMRITLSHTVAPTIAANEDGLRARLALLGSGLTLTATLGANGNGGMSADVCDLLYADDAETCLDEYRKVDASADMIAAHLRDAGLPHDDNTVWQAWDRDLTDDDGYLTGTTLRIYTWAARITTPTT